MSYNNQLPIVQQYFTNTAAIQNVMALQQIRLYEIIGGMLVMIPRCGYIEHELKHIMFYVKRI